MAQEKRYKLGDLSIIAAIFVFVAGVLLAAGVDFDAILGALRVLQDPDYMRGFGLMWLQAIGVSAVGGGVGVALGAIVFRSKYATRSAIPFLRYAQWLPIFAYWILLPSDWLAPFGGIFPRWLLIALWGAGAALPAVVPAACYDYLSFRSALRHAWIRPLITAVLLRSFLVCLWWQIFIQPDGWGWNMVLGPDRAVAAALPIALSSAFIGVLTRTSFEETASTRAAAIASEIEKGGGVALYGATLLAAVSLVLWQLLQTPISELFRIPPPTIVFEATYRLAFADATLWTDIRGSLLEIGGGITLAAIPAFLFSQALPLQNSFRRLTRSVLSLTNLALIGFWLLLFPVVGPGGPWHKMILIGALTFFPLVQTLWGLRHLPVVARLALSLDEALPYAFAGMFFGELYGATVGLGFSIVVFNAVGRPSGAMAVCLVVIALLVGFSLVLRRIAGISYPTSPKE